MNDMLLDYIDRMIVNETDHRVFPVDFDGKKYYVKQDISNHRSSWIKPAPRASFDYEFYKISFVNTKLPVAPVIAGFREHYFVTEYSGRTLSYYSELTVQHPDDTDLKEMVTHIFYIFGKILGQLHDYGLSHGRPAMRDITYDPAEDKITMLDWENSRRWPELTPQGWDVLIFVHSYLREDNLPMDYLYAMMNGYSSACTARDTILHIKDIFHKHEYLIKFCRLLNPFHFVDTEAAVKAYDFIMALKTE
ncbi:hypothetical protein [Veillonella rodentium]|uniref:Bifunctional UGMP family protein/serine/threonine protein kinase n=1 Tax=Veillonella rodentium TaxID=248315 RepID=A0A239ZWP7_9FIRM|nr:hypothetical protein [Veillonella rodentium]SNV75290.1 bifunctional UGMP family protein/serine/threonine protein kinase [Veillonella rodentium]